MIRRQFESVWCLCVWAILECDDFSGIYNDDISKIDFVCAISTLVQKLMFFLFLSLSARERFDEN